MKITKDKIEFSNLGSTKQYGQNRIPDTICNKHTVVTVNMFPSG